MNKFKFFVSGMHCVSCEIILEKSLLKIPEIKKCKINHKSGIVEVYHEKKINISKIKEVVKNCGYQFNEKNKNIKRFKAKPDYFQIILSFIFLFAVFLVFKKLDLIKFIPNFSGEINILIALFLGLVASLSTCLALIGGIVMSFGNLVEVENVNKHSFLSRALPHFYFHFGRILSFTFLGGMLGLLGSKINYSLNFTAYLTIAIALIMFYIGLQILNIVPNITKLGFHLPKFISNKINYLEKRDHHLMPILIGALTFFLPCGFTQTVQLAAVSSQSFWSGALIMSAFAIGTFPILFLAGIGSTYAKQGKAQLLNNIIGVFIIFFSLYSLNSGLVLAGYKEIISFSNQEIISADTEILNDVQVVKMDINWIFQPNQFQVKKGIPVRWEINGIKVSGCSDEIVIPRLNISKKIAQGINIIEFTPQEKGVLPFSCWMGMLTGNFIVTD